MFHFFFNYKAYEIFSFSRIMFTFSEYEGIFQLKNKCEIKKKKGEKSFSCVGVCSQICD